MAAGVQAQVEQTYPGRARGVWVVMMLSALLFCVVCSASGVGIYSYLTSVMRPQTAILRLVTSDPDAVTQLLVTRRGEVASTAVLKEATISQGDQVRTGPATDADITLFDLSTARLFFGSTVTLETLQSSRFIGSAERVVLSVDSGTVILSTAPLDSYTQADYIVRTAQAEVRVEPNSTVRVQVLSEQNVSYRTQVVVTYGSAEVLSHGERVVLLPGQMTAVEADTPPEAPRLAAQDLIRNGGFTEPATSGAEFDENGGLDTAAWLPLRSAPGESPTDGGVVEVITEETSGSSVKAARISLKGGEGQVGTVGFRQQINQPAEYFHNIALRLRVKIVEQADPPGGPRGDQFPLTVAVLYTDPNGRAQQWRHSFYLHQGAPLNMPSATQIGQAGAWETLEDWDAEGRDPAAQAVTSPTAFNLKSTEGDTIVGQDIAVINEIHIYGIGSGFQSWVTDIALMAR